MDTFRVEDDTPDRYGPPARFVLVGDLGHDGEIRRLRQGEALSPAKAAADKNCAGWC